MGTAEAKPAGTDPAVLADLRAVLDSVTSGAPLDPEVARRVRERSERIQREIQERHGLLNVAVDLIREGRDEL